MLWIYMYICMWCDVIICFMFVAAEFWIRNEMEFLGVGRVSIYICFSVSSFAAAIAGVQQNQASGMHLFRRSKSTKRTTARKSWHTSSHIYEDITYLCEYCHSTGGIFWQSTTSVYCRFLFITYTHTVHLYETNCCLQFYRDKLSYSWIYTRTFVLFRINASILRWSIVISSFFSLTLFILCSAYSTVLNNFAQRIIFLAGWQAGNLRMKWRTYIYKIIIIIILHKFVGKNNLHFFLLFFIRFLLSHCAALRCCIVLLP